jgi:hypothetical protein
LVLGEELGLLAEEGGEELEALALGHGGHGDRRRGVAEVEPLADVDRGQLGGEPLDDLVDDSREELTLCVQVRRE